jgi:hypothetical protein
MTPRAEKIRAMRRLLTFVEANPELPLPYFSQLDAFAHLDDDGYEVKELTRIMSPCTKRGMGTFFTLIRDFGAGVMLHLNFPREDVCERVVIGTEEVPEKVIPAHVQEIVEWKCPDGILS